MKFPPLSPHAVPRSLPTPTLSPSSIVPLLALSPFHFRMWRTGRQGKDRGTASRLILFISCPKRQPRQNLLPRGALFRPSARVITVIAITSKRSERRNFPSVLRESDLTSITAHFKTSQKWTDSSEAKLVEGYKTATLLPEHQTSQPEPFSLILNLQPYD